MGISQSGGSTTTSNTARSLQHSLKIYFWSNYSDLTRPHAKWWLSKGNPLKETKGAKVVRKAKQSRSEAIEVEAVATSLHVNRAGCQRQAHKCTPGSTQSGIV